MDLTRRINTLRGQSGAQASAPEPAPSVSSGNDLVQRLGRLQQARRTLSTRREPVSDTVLAKQVGGRVLSAGLVLVERQLPLPHDGLANLRACLKGLPEARRVAAPDWVFIDTETSGLAGGTGTIAFMLGLARVDGDGLTVRQYLLSRFAGERMMLEHALAWVGEDAGWVSYNGKTFDLPLLKTRTRLAGLTPAAWERPHLDLLHGTRRCFDRHWPDCRLATAEQELLGVKRHDDLPGSEAPAAWLAHLQGGDPGRLPGVLDHNRQDLVSLAGLLPALADVQRGASDRRGDAGRIARGWLRHGDSAQARALLEAVPGGLNAPERLMLASLRYRAGEQAAALVLLEDLAGNGSAEAVEQLAKHHEHISRDLLKAMRYARALPASTGKQRRLLRLDAKRGANLELPF